MTGPTVDVVIATYNRQARVVRTLQSLDHQIVRGFGVLVVDDGSQPAVTTRLPAEFLGRDDIRILSAGGNRGPAAARNLALAESDADLIAFIDDDVDADPRWLAAHLTRWRTCGERSVIIGPLLAPHDWKPTPWNRWEAVRLAREYQRMEDRLYEPTWRQFFTGNALARRQDIVDAGGFNEHFTRAEDIELGLRLARIGCRFVFEPAARGWHYAQRSAGAWLANADRYACFDAEMDQLYTELDWLDIVRGELAARGKLSRWTRALTTGCMGERGTVFAAVQLARLFNRGPFAGLSVRAAGLAYDIRYRSALERVGPFRNPVAPAMLDAQAAHDVDAPSTVQPRGGTTVRGRRA